MLWIAAWDGSAAAPRGGRVTTTGAESGRAATDARGVRPGSTKRSILQADHLKVGADLIGHRHIQTDAGRQALEEPALLDPAQLAGFGRTLQGYADEAGELQNINP